MFINNRQTYESIIDSDKVDGSFDMSSISSTRSPNN